VNHHRTTEVILLLVAATLVAGCFNPAVTIDRRSAIEQQLTRSAIWRTVGALAIHKDTLEGPWRVEVVAPDVRESDWIQLALEHRLKGMGVDVRRAEDTEAGTVIVGVVHAGTDIDNFYVGVPIPGSGGMALGFYQSVTERGRAEMFLSFVEADGDPIATTEVVHKDAHFTDMYVLTIIGPFALTDLDIETSTRLTEIGADTLREATERGEWVLPGKERSDEGDTRD